MDGFDQEFPPQLLGVIDEMDYSLIMYKFNSQINSFKSGFIQFNTTNFITFVLCVVLFFVSFFKVSNQWLNLEITGAIGLFTFLAMLHWIYSSNRSIVKNLSDDTLKLSNRYKDTGMRFDLIEKSIFERKTSGWFSRNILMAANYHIELTYRYAIDEREFAQHFIDLPSTGSIN
ncbi:hypothetical protein SAMD00019534_015640 [Acytostelium subglobosum LB1]|uniref:hypothetical protein n=1 Tax=Acytostelium subglobosum LB1 TaxID=1410327 RepID=UPI0006448E08|nr:hypothetical protein SAMD00019534_015640 [Acytostelium subglobosum LB1]GAM18389.1 hypothetical protein SAMD00019534_015640 [Acytostelium subglobosum LB1]|eukprot:XP_012757609.1 hypothetical protein SAMD00019534_015640 [Acytostelium subglobosum LB1]